MPFKQLESWTISSDTTFTAAHKPTPLHISHTYENRQGDKEAIFDHNNHEIGYLSCSFNKAEIVVIIASLRKPEGNLQKNSCDSSYRFH